MQTYLLTAPTGMTIGPFHNIVFSLQHQLLPIHYFSINFLLYLSDYQVIAMVKGWRGSDPVLVLCIMITMVQVLWFNQMFCCQSHMKKMVEIPNNALPRYIHTQYKHREKRSVIHDDRSVATDLITESTGFQVLV